MGLNGLLLSKDAMGLVVRMDASFVEFLRFASHEFVKPLPHLPKLRQDSSHYAR
jgi:hypothetical protein